MSWLKDHMAETEFAVFAERESRKAHCKCLCPLEALVLLGARGGALRRGKVFVDFR